MEQPHAAASKQFAENHPPMTAHEFARKQRPSHVIGAEAVEHAPTVNPYMAETAKSAMIAWRSDSLAAPGHLASKSAMNAGSFAKFSG